MLAFFRSTQSYAGLPFLLYALLLQLPVFFGWPPEVGPPRQGEVFGVMGNYLATWSVGNPWLAKILPAVLLTILGLQVSVLTNRYHFTRVGTQLPALGVLLVWGLIPGLRLLHPALVANIFLLAATTSVAGVYKNPYPQINLFNAGVWLGLAALFVPGYLLFLFPIYLAANILGKTGLASLLRLVIGVGVVYFVGGTLAYYLDDLSEFLGVQVPALSFLSRPHTNPFVLGSIGLLLLLLVLLLSQSANLKRLINIQGSKGLDMLYLLLLFCPLVVLFTSGLAPVDTYTLIVPLGILLGLWLQYLSERAAELVHLLVFAAAFLFGASHLIVLLTAT